MNNSNCLDMFTLTISEDYDDPLSYFIDYTPIMENYIQEVTDGATRKNIFTKIWEFLKKLFRLISKGISKIINFIISLFKKGKKSADQIIRGLGINQSNSNKSSEDEISFTIPSDSRSEIELSNEIALLASNSIEIQINEDSSMNFFIHELIQDLSIQNDELTHHVKNTKFYFWNHVVRALIFIRNPKLTDSLLSYIESLVQVLKSSNSTPISINTIEIIYRELEQIIPDDMKLNWNYRDKITLKQFQEFSIKLNKMQQLMEEIDDISIDSSKKEYKGLIDALNVLSDRLSYLQLGVNGIGRLLKNVYLINSKYVESISDIETLSKFVQNMIDAAIPPKFICFNTYLISHKSINGKGDEFNPIWGQSRFIFLPSSKKDIIYKIALSQWGIRSNLAERKITKLFTENNVDSILAKVVSSTTNSAIITSERANTNITEIKRARIAGELVSYINTKLSKLKLELTIGDVHYNNVGIINKRKVILDYGWTYRAA